MIIMKKKIIIWRGWWWQYSAWRDFVSNSHHHPFLPVIDDRDIIKINIFCWSHVHEALRCFWCTYAVMIHLSPHHKTSWVIRTVKKKAGDKYLLLLKCYHKTKPPRFSSYWHYIVDFSSLLQPPIDKLNNNIAYQDSIGILN